MSEALYGQMGILSEH